MESTTEWAREHGTAYTGVVTLDNHEPPRERAALKVHTYAAHPRTGDPGAVIEDVSALRDGTAAVYLLDDGHIVVPHYVATWHPEGTHVVLHPFPTNYGEDGQPRTRADNGQPVDYRGWSLGPRRAYHVKLSLVYPRRTGDGRTVWACCESSIGPTCQHLTPPTGDR